MNMLQDDSRYPGREELIRQLRSILPEARFRHSLGVQQMAKKLAVRYGLNPKKAAIAGLLHDWAKIYSEEELLHLARKYNLRIDPIQEKIPQLLHGPVGSELLPIKFAIDDQEIRNAVKYHSTGRPGMTFLEKIIFIADYIEPGRTCDGISELRELAFFDLESAVVAAAGRTISYHLNKGDLLHPLTIYTRNYYLGKDEPDGGQEAR
ncbi:MAG: bis(5'-nucleosyl)-tetraphosphatase (symmetrical) YqeK [Halanaerobium sp.]|nr:bis(5'-nucleosyl)-tetraphosphatase (symmetrical) YqeK [Halanaerobium sp.]